MEELIEKEIVNNGGEWAEDENCKGAVGMTMFDLPNSQDNLITILIPKHDIRKIGSHSIVEIRSRTDKNGGDGRIYRGIVVEGPFHEPDGIRADSPMIVSTTIHGAIFMPDFHGKIQVELIGEMKDNILIPPRFRPLPNSPVFVLNKDETGEVLKVKADPGITLGLAIGHDDIEVQFPSNKKNVIPRHIGILGTTGGGKSTTVSGLMAQYQKQGIATIIIDTEGEYTHVDKPTEDKAMINLLTKRNIPIDGINNIRIFHLFESESRAEQPTPIFPFTINFSALSPYAAADILGLNDAQFGRFFKAYEAVKRILKELKVYPQKGQEKEAIQIDEFETGYPKVTLALLIDVSNLILNKISGGDIGFFLSDLLKTKESAIDRIIEAVTKTTDNESSWKALLGKLWQLYRTKVFDNPKGNQIPFSELIQSGQISIIDLSGSDLTIINNIVIANVLREIQQEQEKAYEKAIKKEQNPTPVSIIIEEAHEFLSREKISKMPNLFEQVAKISRRGRKRWLGLVFVTQLPQHLPDEMLGLINSYILHKINDANVVNRLKRSIGGVDNSLWNKLPNLAPGQAIVSIASLSRPLLVVIDPTPCKLLMVD